MNLVHTLFSVSGISDSKMGRLRKPGRDAFCWLLVLMVWCEVASVVVGDDDYDLILTRMHESAMSEASHQSLNSLLAVLQPDGSFSDLSYGSDGSDSYSTHGRRQGAFAYHYLNGEDVLAEVLLCFTFITYDAPPNTDINWWGHVIGTPTHMWEGAVLARNIISSELLSSFLDRYWVNTQDGPVWNPSLHTGKMAGGNLGPRALLAEVEGVLRGEASYLARHVEVMQELYRELAQRQPWQDQGLRPDGCLHQHNPQGGTNTENGYLDHNLGLIYNGNYGKEMLRFLSEMFTWFTGTTVDFDNETIEGLFSCYLECNQWLFRGTVFEPTTTGRFIDGGSSVTSISARGSVSKAGLYLLKLGRHQDEVEAALHRYEHVTPDSQYALVGNKYFYNSDLMVHQRQDYMTSVRVLSNRTSRQETWKSGQNIDGYFQGDGFMTVVVDGGEIGSSGKEVFQVYDWAKVPGVTNLYTTDIPQYHLGTYWAEQFINNADFAGGVTDGLVGVTSMDFNRPHVDLTALKSWFFFEDVVVVVGSRINLSEGDATGENVITTLAQVMYSGEHVLGTSNGKETTLGLGETEALSPAYLHHRKVGYVFLQGDENLSISAAKRSLNSDELEVFTAWMSHGTAPNDVKLSYAVLPSADLVRTRAFHSNPEVELAEVSLYTHVVCHKPSKTVGASIGYVRSISVASCGETGAITLEVDTPCLALITVDSETVDEAQVRVTLADPQQDFTDINLTLHYNGRSASTEVVLPISPNRGASVTIVLVV